MAKVVSHRPFTAVARLWSRANSFESWADRMALGQNFRQVLSISPVRIIPPVLQSYLHLHVALNKKDKRAKPDNLPEKKHCSVGCLQSMFSKLLNGQPVRDLWWTKWYCDRCFFEYSRLFLVSIMPPVLLGRMQSKQGVLEAVVLIYGHIHCVVTLLTSN